MDTPRFVSIAYVIVANAIVVLLGHAAAAGEPGWYVGGAGLVTGAESDFDYAAGADEAEYRVGGGAALFVGYRFALGLRTEFELSHRSNDIRNIDTTILQADNGSTHAETAMANLYYDFRNASRFTPYVGGGIGVAQVRHDLVQFVAGDTVHDENTSLAGQAIAGVSFQLTDHWEAFADYRYLWSAEQSTVNSGGVGVGSNYTSQSINLGLTYGF